MKKHKTKRALLSSALSLLLCVAMLIGTTFAWFTDSVTSANNIIKSGNLDVTMEWADGKTNPETTTWTDASTGAIFDYDLWEPGYTEVRHIKIANEGSLALKYQLNIIANGIVSDLSDVIDVYYMDPAEQVGDRDDLTGKTPLGTLTQVLDNLSTTASGNLKAGENHTVTIALKMQESAGNEYQDKAIGTNFSVQLLATQLTAEKDSFDDQYDKDAEYVEAWDGTVGTVPAEENGVVTISSAAELAGFAEAVNNGNNYSGKTVVLANDINLGGANWTSIGTVDFDHDNSGLFSNAVLFEGTFDGQGNTIYNLTSSNGRALFGAINKATIKNVNVKNVDITGDNTVAAIAAYSKATSTITNCHVSGAINLVVDWAYVAGIAAYGYYNISDCSVIADGTGVIKAKNRNAVGGIGGWINEGNSITNCAVKNLDITGWANVGAIAGFISNKSTVDKCSAENINLTKTREDGIASIGLASGGWVYGANKTISITNNTFKNITLNGKAEADNGANILYGSGYDRNSDPSIITVSNNTQTSITNNLVIQ